LPCWCRREFGIGLAGLAFDFSWSVPVPISRLGFGLSAPGGFFCSFAGALPARARQPTRLPRSRRSTAITVPTFTPSVPSGDEDLADRAFVDGFEFHRRLVGFDLGQDVARRKPRRLP
jgi:hypothetical protein